jgi:hypothetical protein
MPVRAFDPNNTYFDITTPFTAHPEQMDRNVIDPDPGHLQPFGPIGSGGEGRESDAPNPLGTEDNPEIHPDWLPQWDQQTGEHTLMPWAQPAQFRVDSTPEEIKAEAQKAWPTAATPAPRPVAGIKPPDLALGFVSPGNQYPSLADAMFAQKMDYGYGQNWTDHFQDKVATLALEPLFIPEETTKEAAKRIFETKAGDRVVAELPEGARNFVRREMQGMVARGALAAARDPIAALGFDPKNTVMDVLSKPTTLYGMTVTWRDGKPVNPIKTAVNVASENFEKVPSTIVHESIHRGMEILRREAPETMKEFTDIYDRWGQAKAQGLSSANAEEFLVRHIMTTVMGDPEAESAGKQRTQAMEFMKDPKNLIALDRLRATAAQLISQKHPRGPR